MHQRLIADTTGFDFSFRLFQPLPGIHSHQVGRFNPDGAGMAAQFCRRLFNIRGIYHNHPDFRWFSSPAGRISVPLQGVKNVSSVFQEVFCAEHALIVHNGQASVFQLKQIVHPQLIGFHHRNI